jgi:hypothetical protein
MASLNNRVKSFIDKYYPNYPTYEELTEEKIFDFINRSITENFIFDWKLPYAHKLLTQNQYNIYMNLYIKILLRHSNFDRSDEYYNEWIILQNKMYTKLNIQDFEKSDIIKSEENSENVNNPLFVSREELNIGKFSPYIYSNLY